MNQNSDQRFLAEETFHDGWAESTEVEKIDVLLMNESVTAPEMRYIMAQLGSIKGKTLLDVGCGLGEASVYFALKGANVTATDISGGMLEATKKLAKKYNIKVGVHKSTAENLNFRNSEKFDIIYVGNLFHHTEIESTILQLKEVMHPKTILVSIDPVHYNPVINVYRKIANKVRTEDEHPFKMSDIAIFEKHFNRVEKKFFWFTTLIIFVIMAIVQFRNPNKERYWKVVVEEGNKWHWLYAPLEKFDTFLLNIFPFLGWLCWNIVLRVEGPKNISDYKPHS